MNKIRRISTTALVAFGLLSLPFFVSSHVSAYSYKLGADATIDKIMNKNAHKAVDVFKDSVTLRSAIGHYIPEFLIGDDGDCKVPMPNTIIAGSEDSSPKLTCKEFLTGKGSSWNGIVGDAKKIKIESGITNQQTTADAIKSYGYSRVSAAPFKGTEQRCMRAHIKDHTRSGADKSMYEKDTDNKICALVDNSDGLILDVFVDSDNTDDSWEYWFVEEGEYEPFASSAYGTTFNLNYTGNWSMFSGGITVTFDDMPTWSEFVGEWEQRAKDKNGGYASCDKNLGTTASCVTIIADQGSGGGVEDEEMTWDTTYKKGTSAIVVEALLGYPYAKSLSTAEVFNIYNQYLNNTSYVEVNCDADYDYSSDTLYKWMHVLVKRDDKIDDTCWAREKQKVLYTGAVASPGSFDPQTNTLTSGGYYFTRENMSLQDIINQINGFDLEAILNDIDDVNDPASPPSSSDGEDGKVEPTCANSGGAASLGWIVCPILDWMQEAATNAYNDYVEPNLMVQSTLFQDEGDATREAWTIFQGFANVCFIILFLVVIFSQLTGVGIDNYGIKKLLPKIIVVAVLVNLSYLICVLCVDLSNILGNAFQSLFNGLGVDGSASVGKEVFKGSGAGATVITAVALVSALFLVGKAVWENPAILLTLLVSALGVLIAIFFLFILLAGRKAAIVVLTVISPLAFVCYMLPNLKRQFFDKWLKFWEGLLLVYPICGLLIGGGDFVSRLLLVTLSGGDGFFGAFTAMIVGIIPVFMIPTVLKGAFAAMGTIGSKITGFGDRIRGGATRGLRNSEGYKNLQERSRETGIRRKAGYDRNGNKKELNGFQRFVRGGRRNIQRNALAYQKLQSEKGSLAATEGKNYMLATETANEAKRIVSSGEINNTGRVGVSGSLTDGLYRALMSNDRAKIQAYTDALSGKGEDGRVAVKSAYNQAVGAGMSGAAAQTFANNILANHGADYKNNNRSMFEVAKSINQGEQATSTDNHLSNADNRAKLAGKVTASTIGNMDDDAFGEIFGGYNNKAVSIPDGADAKQIGAAAYAALSSQNANIKAERRSYLEKIVSNSGYTPETQNVNVTNMPRPAVTAPGSAEEGRTFEVPRENRPAGNTGNKNDVQVNPGEGDDQGTWD